MKSRHLLYLLISIVFLHKATGQFEKNAVIAFDEIEKGEFGLVVEKYVRLPTERIEGIVGLPPRINTFAYAGDRNFVGTEDEGNIYEIHDDGTFTKLVSLKDFLPAQTGLNLQDGGWHGGLRGLAFHPNFSSNGKFFVTFMGERPANPEVFRYLYDDENKHESGLSTDAVVAELTYDFDQMDLDESSYREVLRIGIDYFDHTIKQMTFNPYAQPGEEDYGTLYLAHGDSGDQSAPPDAGTRSDPFGKILRINPLQDGEMPYSIPTSNPFVGDDSMLDEVYALGFRNPHHLSFNQDAEGKVHLISADTGRDNIEEINLIKPGGNYGWAEREGTFVFKASGGLRVGIEALPADDAANSYVYPAVQWIHSGPNGAGFVSQAIAGGYVVEVEGQLVYLHAEFAGYGRVFYSYLEDMLSAKTLLANGETPESLTQAPIYEFNMFVNDHPTALNPTGKSSMKDIVNDDSDYDFSGRADLRFGRDQAGNIYITSKRNRWVYKVSPLELQEELLSLQDKTSQIQVYPNPVTGLTLYFTNLTAETAHLEITDAAGKKVNSGEVKGGTFPYFNHPAGVYFLHLFAEGQTQTIKIVKDE